MVNSGLSLQANHGKRSAVLFIVLIILLILLILADLMTGTVKIPFANVFGILVGKSQDNTVWSTILYEFRIPKTIAAILAGSALSVSGLQMQTIFRNPLAGPDVLGVSSGASLGVALVVMGFGSFFMTENVSYLGSWVQIAAAWAGAGTVLFMVMFVSLRVRDIMTILILGILFGSAASAFVSIHAIFQPTVSA